jgi:predicted nucleotidyltransferase
LFSESVPEWKSDLAVEQDGLCGIKHGMNKQEILDRLRENERALRERGVTHAALFGSRARGEERSDSDIDIMVEVDPDAHISLFDYAGIVQYIEELFPAPVDVANREGLKPFVRPSAERESRLCFLTRRNWP